MRLDLLGALDRPQVIDRVGHLDKGNAGQVLGEVLVKRHVQGQAADDADSGALLFREYPGRQLRVIVGRIVKRRVIGGAQPPFYAAYGPFGRPGGGRRAAHNGGHLVVHRENNGERVAVTGSNPREPAHVAAVVFLVLPHQQEIELALLHHRTGSLPSSFQLPGGNIGHQSLPQIFHYVAPLFRLSSVDSVTYIRYPSQVQPAKKVLLTAQWVAEPPVCTWFCAYLPDLL